MNKDEISICFEDDQWLILPKTPDKSIFEPGTFTVSKSFEFIAKYDHQLKKNPLICPSVFQTITFLPSAPTKINPLEEDSQQIVLKNSEVLPDLTFVCYDAYNNRTIPDPGTVWKLEMVYDGSFKGDKNFVVTNDGEIILRNITVDHSGFIPSDGLIVEISGFLVSSNKHEVFNIQMFVSVKIVPSQVATSIEVLLNDEPLPQPWVLKVGSVISGLSFRILDESDLPIEIDESMFSTTSHIDESWTKRKLNRGKKACCNQKLSTLYISNEIPKDKTEDYDVGIYMIGTNLSYQFSITVVPEDPIKWKLFHLDSITDGVVCGNASELESSIKGTTPPLIFNHYPHT
jgi:hypothetical protein